MSTALVSCSSVSEYFVLKIIALRGAVMTASLKNPFEFHPESNVIACVGENGGTHDASIVKGFTEAVKLLLDHAARGGVEDAIVYPLVYSARHAIELSLKIFIDLILEIIHFKGDKVKKPINPIEVRKNRHTHDIKKLTAFISEIYDFDERISDIYATHSKNIDLFYIDPEGDMFKYQRSTAGAERLKEERITHICLDLFVSQFLELQKQLEIANHKLSFLVNEYEQKTFTKTLSRKQLFEIAQELPLRSEWRNPEFGDIRASVKGKYNLSSKELSEAISTIENHREFSAEIGVENIFRNLSPAAILEYRKIVTLRAETEVKPSRTLTMADCIKELSTTGKSKNEAFKQSTLTAEDIAMLLAFWEVGGTSYYSEQLDMLYDFHSKPPLQKNWALNKITTTNAFEKICCGMRKCGQATYLKLMHACP